MSMSRDFPSEFPNCGAIGMIVKPSYLVQALNQLSHLFAMNMSCVCIDSKLMTDDKNDAMFCLGKVVFASVATKRRARA